MSWEANSMFKKLLHGKRKSALLNLTWSGLLCRVVWSVSQLLYLLQRAGHFKFFSPSFFVGLELTKRQLQVLQLIAEGKSTKDIAARIGLSAKTVETHRIKIMDKLNLYIPSLN